MKYIKLTMHTVATIDDRDYHNLSKMKWCLSVKNNKRSFYAVHNQWIDGKPKMIYMHRVIMGAQYGQDVHHINHDTLDNRRCNLKLCSRADNIRNMAPTGGASKYKGVFRNKKNWQARIMFNYKRINLGTFEKEEDAALAYNEGSKKYHGEYAYTNCIGNK